MKVLKIFFQWLIPLLSAFLIWLMIVSQKDYTIIMDTPIEVYEPRPDKILKNDIPATAQVMFRGNGRHLMISKYFDHPKLILDVSTISRRYKFNLNEYFSKYPNRVVYPQNSMTYLEVVYPESINVLIDEKITRDIPVHINASVQTKTGYIITHQAEADPSKISITGPRSLIRGLKLIESKDLQLSGVSQSFSQDIALINPEPSFLTMNPENVNFSMKIESLGERQLSNLPVKIVNAPPDLDIKVIPADVSLTIVGGNDVIQNVKPEDIGIQFDYASQWIPNTHYYIPVVEIPTSVIEWKNLIPKTIEVAIVRK